MDWFELLISGYPTFFGKMSKKEREKLKQVYLIVLKDFGEDILYDAATSWLAKGTFAPAAAELKAEAERITAERAQTIKAETQTLTEAINDEHEFYKAKFPPYFVEAITNSYGADWVAKHNIWKLIYTETMANPKERHYGK